MKELNICCNRNLKKNGRQNEDTEVVRHLGPEVVLHPGSEVRHCFGGAEVVRH